jgi:CRISPR-associated RAMP protein (TIGR02581 family)
MFRKSYNRAVLRIRIETVSPLLIRAGSVGLDPTSADLVCVRTRHARHHRTVYIPGSSLKGVMRASVEAVLRSLSESPVQGACNPFGKEREGDASCSSRLQGLVRNHASTAQIYQGHCLACRSFGSTVLKGRIGVSDLFPWSEVEGSLSETSRANFQRANETEVRNNVAIDRISGAVAVGPFDQELVVPGVSFWGELSLENYQLWQLGLLVTAIDELNTGFAQLGSSKSRGLGVVRVHVEQLVHEQVRRGERGPCGVGDLADAGERQAYGLLDEVPLPAGEGQSRGLALRFEPSASDIDRWLEAGRNALGRL